MPTQSTNDARIRARFAVLALLFAAIVMAACSGDDSSAGGATNESDGATNGAGEAASSEATSDNDDTSGDSDSPDGAEPSGGDDSDSGSGTDGNSGEPAATGEDEPAPPPTTVPAITTTTTTTTTTTLPLPAAIEIPSGAREMASADGSTFWITIDNGTEGSVAVVEGSPPQYTSLIPVGFQPRGVAVASDGGVWVVDKGPVTSPSFDGGRVLRIDPTTRQITAAFDVPGINPEGIEIIGTDVWVGTENSAVAVDMGTGSLTVVPVPDEVIDGATRLTSGDGSLWAVDTYFSRRVTRIDAGARQTAGLPIEIQDAQTTDVAYAAGSVWVTDRGTTDVSRSNTLLHRIDVGRGGLSTSINIGAQGFAVDADERGVYVAANDRTDAPSASSLVIVDPATNSIVSTTPVNVPASDVIVDRSIVWVLAGSQLTPLRAL